MGMDYYLNRVDPQLIKVVNEITAENVVHRKEDLIMQKEEGQRQKDKNPPKKMNKEEAKKKVDDLNEFVETNHLDIYFVLEEEKNVLSIKVFEKGTDKYIRTFDEYEIEKLLQKLSTISGLIVDIKG